MFQTLLFCVSIFIAGCAAYFSVKGIGLLFAGSFMPVVIMASSLEVGKLFAVSLLYRQWHVMRWLYKMYLTAACGALIFITSLGIFGFLSDAYQDTKTKVDHFGAKIVSLESQTVNIREQIMILGDNTESNKQSSTESIDKYKKIYDDYVTQSNTRSEQLNNKIQEMDSKVAALEGTSGGLFSSKKKKLEQLRLDQQSERLNISSQLDEIADKMSAEYNSFLTKVDTFSNSKANSKDISKETDTLYEQIRSNDDMIIQYKSDISQTDIGSFKFISESFGVPIDQAVKWFILMIVMVFDPLAICLIIGYNMLATSGRSHIKVAPVGEPQKKKTKIVPVRGGSPDDFKLTETTPGGGRVITFGKNK